MLVLVPEVKKKVKVSQLLWQSKLSKYPKSLKDPLDFTSRYEGKTREAEESEATVAEGPQKLKGLQLVEVRKVRALRDFEEHVVVIATA